MVVKCFALLRAELLAYIGNHQFRSYMYILPAVGCSSASTSCPPRIIEQRASGRPRRVLRRRVNTAVLLHVTLHSKNLPAVFCCMYVFFCLQKLHEVFSQAAQLYFQVMSSNPVLQLYVLHIF